MVIYSSRSSIQNEEVSALAIVETLAAVTILFLICYKNESLAPLALGSIIAPFLLLKTQRSIKQALNIADALLPLPFGILFGLYSWLARKSLPLLRINRAVFIIVFSVIALSGIVISTISAAIIVLLSIVIKVLVTTYNFFFHFLECLEAIPSNWRKVVLCTDTATLPELIPGAAESKLDGVRIVMLETMFAALARISKEGAIPVKIAGYSMMSIVIAVSFIPAVAYRLSLKSTALIWSPLLWAVNPIRKAENVRHYALGVKQLARNRIARGYSVFIAIILLGKFGIWILWLQLGQSLRQVLTSPAIDRYLAPEDIITWHLAAFVNAILSWWMFFRADEYLHESSGGQSDIDAPAKKFFKYVGTIKNILTIYTLFCAIYITASLSARIQLPPLKFILVPW